MNRFGLGDDQIYERMKTTQQQLVDEYLVMACQDGQDGAWDKLVRRWQQRLWQHAYRLTGRADAAWEVTQNAWLGIVKGVHKLNDPARFRFWAYRIITNKSADWIRVHKRRKEKTQELAEDPPARPARHGDVAELLEGLGHQQRAILSLRYVEEFSISEIADILDIPQGTVKSRLFQARNELRKRLEHEAHNK